MSNDHSTDKFFRDRLLNAEVPPPHEVWNNVEKQLHNRRRRRVLLLFFALGLGLSGTIGYFNNWLGTSKPAEHVNAVLPVASVPTTIQPVSTEQSATYPVAEIPAASGNASTQKSGAEIPQLRNPQLPKLTMVQHPSNHHVTDKGQLAIISNILSAETTATADVVPPSGVVVDEKPVDAANFARPENFETIAERPMPMLPIKEQALATVYATGKHKKQKDRYHFDHKNTFWMVDLYTGFNVLDKQLSVTDPKQTSYMNKRNETERYDWAFSGGVQATVLLHQHFRISTGLHYDQITEVFEFTDPNAVDYIVTERNNPDTIGKITGTRYIKSFNRFGMLEVPLMVGYEWRKARWGFNINAGASANLLFGYDGRMMADAGRNVMQFSTIEAVSTPSPFNAKTGFSLMSNAQVFYHIRPQWRIFVAPYVRQQLQSITTTEHQIQQRYTIGGLQVGMTRILN
jgi:Outer membrane protein beta-barrel domain